MTPLEQKKQELKVIGNFYKFTGQIVLNKRQTREHAKMASDLLLAIEALEYYTIDLEYKESIRRNNYCHDFCPKGCVEHTFESIARTRPACHDRGVARTALNKIIEEG